MEQGYGGPVWHASIRTFAGDMRLAEEMALAALRGCGDASLGEWREQGSAFHIRRRLTADEARLAGNLTVRDIRGTAEERRRFALLVADAPHLRALIATASTKILKNDSKEQS